MGIQQPAVSVTENTFAVEGTLSDSAVPLIIGFTEKRPADVPVYITSFSDFESQFGGPHTGDAVLYYAVRHFFDNGGQGGYIFSLSTFEEMDAVASPPIYLTESPVLPQVIAAEESITLLAFPDSVLIPDEDIPQWQQCWRTMLSLCQVRSGLFAVLDAPDSPAQTKKCLESFNSMHSEGGGVWWPRLVTTYQKGDALVTVPASGAVLAAIQETDSTSGVWSAPANTPLSQVIQPTFSWLDAVDLFNPNGASVNLIRSFAGRGTRIWGCRTLSPDLNSSYRYVQTRRLMSWCEMNISNLARMFVFEPNSELTWYKIKGFTIMWLRDLWLLGGLYGEQEQDAFQVLLGLDESMTNEDILAGRMVMNVRLAMLSPAEFIDLSLVFMMNGEPM
ncbi:phage tail sheath family protein [Enterobacter ludwigii]